MSSFYGGKEGRTYNIVQRYDSVAQMVEAFSGGGAYTGANYGLYVIIDTIMNLNHKSDLENGLLYRRGFDYNDAATNHPKPKQLDYLDVNNNLKEEEWQAAWANWVSNPGGGAIYIGQIVGPLGDSPEITPVKWDDIKDKAGVKIIIPVSTTKGNEVTPSSTIQTPSGIVYKGDTIKVASLTVRDGDNDGNIIGAKIAFDIPNLVEEPGIITTDPYEEASFKENPASTAHPFWYMWDLQIPGGKRGQDIETIDILTGQQTSEEEDGFGNPIVSEDEYFTYSVKDYQDSADGVLTEHLGRWPYRVIKNISQNEPVSRSIITWAVGTEVSVGDLYRVDGRYLDNCYWICTKAGAIKENDSLPDIISLNQMGNYANELQLTEWCAVNIPLTAPAHTLIVDYRAGLSNSFGVRNVDYLAVDEDNRLYAYYSDSNEPHYLTKINSLKRKDGIILTDSGIQIYYTNGNENFYPLKQILSIDFKTGSPQKNDDGSWKYDENNKLVFDSNELNSKLKIRYKDGTKEESDYEIKRIESIDYDNKILTEDQNITVTYKGELPTTINTSPIDMVRAIQKKGDNVYVLYANPVTRKTIQDNGTEGIDWIKLKWTDPITGEIYDNGTESGHREMLVWRNFNSLDGQAQYHVYGEVTYNDLKTWLAQGFRDFTQDSGYSQYGDLSGKAGWLVTVNDDSGATIVKRIYAFDYNSNNHLLPDETSTNWYEIFSLSASQINPELSVIIDTLTYDEQTESFIPTEHSEPLLTNMLWFVKSYGHDNY